MLQYFIKWNSFPLVIVDFQKNCGKVNIHEPELKQAVKGLLSSSSEIRKRDHQLCGSQEQGSEPEF